LDLGYNLNFSLFGNVSRPPIFGYQETMEPAERKKPALQPKKDTDVALGDLQIKSSEEVLEELDVELYMDTWTERLRMVSSQDTFLL
jgi:hypothetical protein